MQFAALSNDHLAWDATETVTVEVTTRSGARFFAVEQAKRRNIRSRERSPSGGAYLGAETNWHLAARDMPSGASVKPGDVVVSGDDRRWTVLTVATNRHGHTLTLGCVDLSIAYDLRDVVTIERAMISYDLAGVASKAWVVRHAEIAAKVQHVSESTSEERDVRATRPRYDVILAKQVSDIDLANDRILWVDRTGANLYLDLLQLRQPERIDELPVVEAELRL